MRARVSRPQPLAMVMGRLNKPKPCRIPMDMVTISPPKMRTCFIDKEAFVEVTRSLLCAEVWRWQMHRDEDRLARLHQYVGLEWGCHPNFCWCFGESHGTGNQLHGADCWVGTSICTFLAITCSFFLRVITSSKGMSCLRCMTRSGLVKKRASSAS